MTEKQFRPLQVAGSIVGMVLMAAASSFTSSTSQFWAMILSGAAFIGVPQFVAHSGRIRRDGIRHHDEALAALTDLCLRLLEIPDSADPRVTLLVVDYNYKKPVLVGKTRACRNNRSIPTSEMSITQGFAGLCYRKQSVVVHEEVLDFLTTMKDLGFEEHEAKQFNMQRKNYACIPIMDGENNVVAILSLDACEPRVYDAARVELAEKFTPFFARLLTTKTTIEE